jgi:hypothetical protein
VWKYLREFVRGYDASIFSLAAFAQPLPHPQYLIAPSIDPLSEKNRELPDEEVAEAAARLGLDADRRVVLQVSRFDRFKDPVGVIRAFRLVRPHVPLQLVLAGGAADDDPEGGTVLQEGSTGRPRHPGAAPAAGCASNDQRAAATRRSGSAEIDPRGIRADGLGSALEAQTRDRWAGGRNHPARRREQRSVSAT